MLMMIMMMMTMMIKKKKMMMVITKKELRWRLWKVAKPGQGEEQEKEDK